MTSGAPDLHGAVVLGHLITAASERLVLVVLGGVAGVARLEDADRMVPLSSRSLLGTPPAGLSLTALREWQARKFEALSVRATSTSGEEGVWHPVA